MKPKKQIEIIEQKCESLGLNIREVFRKADIPEATIGNWRRKEPDAFTVLAKVNETIDLMALEKEGVHVENFSTEFEPAKILEATAIPRRRS